MSKGGPLLDLYNKIVYPGIIIIMLILSLLFSSNIEGGKKALVLICFEDYLFPIPSFLTSFLFFFFFFPMARKIGDRYFPLAKCFMNHNIWEAQPQGNLSTVTYLCKFTWSGSFPFLSVRTKPGSKRIPWLRVSPVTLWRLSFLFSNIVIVTSWKAVTNEGHNLYLLLVFYFTFQSSSHSLWLISLSI